MNPQSFRSKASPGENVLTVVVMVLIMFMLIGLAQAGETNRDEGWRFSIVPYLWALSLDGTLAVKGRKADVDMSFGDIWDNLNIALMGAFEANKGRFGLFANPLYAQLEDDFSTQILSQKVRADITMNMFILEGGVNYRFGPYALDGEPGVKFPTVTLKPFIGGRFTYLDADLNVKGFKSRSADGSQDWFDPIIGTHLIWDFSKRWNLIIGGSIGGFGVGSDFAWSALGLVGYRFNFSKNVTGNVVLGYRALYQDYNDGSGTDRFELDTTMYGPLTGLSIRF